MMMMLGPSDTIEKVESRAEKAEAKSEGKWEFRKSCRKGCAGRESLDAGREA